MNQTEINWQEAGQKATDLLCRYIQVDTTNPPGNEDQGARFLQSVLEPAGIAAELVISGPGRGNLLAHLKGDGTAAPLCLLHHIDVVPSEAPKWQHPPFSGKVVNGEIWGRGALDCKSLGIMQVMVLMLLKQSGVRLRRDLLLAATADEERGGKWGVAWLWQNRPEFSRVEAVINEGGGVGVRRKNHHFYFCQVAEKGVYWVRIRFAGRPGHASIPREDNCIISLGKALERIGRYRSPIRFSPTGLNFIRGLGADDDLAPIVKKVLDPEKADQALLELPDRGLRLLLAAMIRNTFVPTVVGGGEKVNVIPSECFCEVDCRMVPGETPEGIRRELEAILGGIPNYGIEVSQASPPSESSPSHELYPFLEQALAQYDPQARLLPYVSSGATDSRFFRQQKCAAFGFAPLLLDGDLADHQDLIHGHNERISEQNLLFGIKVLYDVVRRYCT